jgi:hypothetical protein
VTNQAGVTLEQLREIAFSFPGVEEHPSYGGRPSFNVRKKFLAWLREERVLALRTVDLIEKQFLLDTQPEVFYTTDHYDGYPAVLVRLERVDREELRHLFEETWRSRATRKLVTELESRRAGSQPG